METVIDSSYPMKINTQFVLVPCRSCQGQKYILNLPNVYGVQICQRCKGSGLETAFAVKKASRDLSAL